MRVVKAFTWLALSIAAACAPVPLMTATAQPAQAAPAATSTAGDYRLGSADKIRVLVFNEPTLSGEFSVGANGALSLPYIGDIAASGRTAIEVSSEIQAKLADGFLVNPRVSVEVLSFRPFYILGEVMKPGEYPYSNGLTVLNAGFTYRADKRKVHVKAAGGGGEVSKPLTSDMSVQPGDTIRIGERFF
jgi:protein involved in polysaccharide export with SLBB domain